jgi:hypothetical protein
MAACVLVSSASVGAVTTESNVTHVLDARSKRLSTTGGAAPGSYTSISLPPNDAQGYRWLIPGCAWCPESRFYQCPNGVYSPELGQPISQQKPPKFKAGKELSSLL